MKWKISYSKRAYKFIEKEKIEERVKEVITKFILKYKRGKNISLDVKKMKGKWKRYYRIKIGKIRVILKVIEKSREIIVDTVDFRESVY